jgi:signal peptidase I
MAVRHRTLSHAAQRQLRQSAADEIETEPGAPTMSDRTPTESTKPASTAPATGGEAAEAHGSGFNRVWREWIKPFLMVLVVVGSLRSAVADWNDVPTGSMRPTILEGERIFVNKLAYDLKVPFTRLRLMEWSSPERGDVVVLYSPADGKRLVKRVMGVPGDVLEMRGGRLFVNGDPAAYASMGEADRDALGIESQSFGLPEELPEVVVWETVGSLTHPVTLTPSPFQSTIRNFEPRVVPEASYFVMGDNRDNSRDSRYFGYVDRELIVGRALAVVVSLDPTHSYSPRWDRFFFGLP